MTILKHILTFSKKTECSSCNGKGKIDKCTGCKGKGHYYSFAGGTLSFCVVVGAVGSISGVNLLEPGNVFLNLPVFIASLVVGVFILKEHKEQTEGKNGNKKSKNRG